VGISTHLVTENTVMATSYCTG